MKFVQSRKAREISGVHGNTLRRMREKSDTSEQRQGRGNDL